MIFILFFTGFLYAGELRIARGTFISYNDETVTIKTKDGKKVKALKNKQSTDFLKSMDKLLGKEVIIHQ